MPGFKSEPGKKGDYPTITEEKEGRHTKKRRRRKI